MYALFSELFIISFHFLCTAASSPGLTHWCLCRMHRRCSEQKIFSFNAFFFFLGSRLCSKTSQKLEESVKKKRKEKKPLSAILAIVRRFQSLFQTTYFMLNPPSVPSDPTQSISRVVLKYSISAGVIWIRQRGRSKGHSWIWWLLEKLFRRSAWV